MGNSCTTEGCALKQCKSTGSSVYSIRPPGAPRNNDEVSPTLMPITGEIILLDLDEGGSPAIDPTKSLESVREWLERIDDCPARCADDPSPELKEPMPGEATLGALWALPSIPAHFDADKERSAGRVVNSLMLVTPKLPKRHTTFF